MSARLLRLRPALLAALALGLALPALAQPGRPAGSVVATVVDAETGAPLPQATVALYGARDSSFATGGAADPTGRVVIDPVRPGQYQIRVSFIGYVTERLASVDVGVGTPTDLGEVRLAESAAQLGEAEVTAQREFIEQAADRTVYNVREQAITTGGSAIETLQTLPSLEVDTDGNISLRGNQNVVIQINGRPVPVRGAFLAALLRQIPADKVDRVEVIPNPSARYEPDGMSGIVNIVLAEGTDLGLSGGLTFGGGTELSGQAGANLNYQRGAWDLNGQYGYRYGERDTERASLLRYLVAREGRPTSVDQAAFSENAEQSHFFNGSAAYRIGESTTLSTEGSLGLRSGDDGGATDFLRTFPGGEDQASIRRSDSDSDGFNGDIALILRRQFPSAGGEAQGQGNGGRGGFRGGRPGRGGPRGGGGAQTDHELAVEARYTHVENDDLGLFTDLLSGDVLAGVQSQLADQTTDEASFQVDYTRPIGALKLEVGGKATDERVASDSEFRVGPSMNDLVVDPNQTNAFDYDRQILAAYVQGARPVGPLQVQVGLRAEVAQRAFSLATPLPEGYNPGFDVDEAGEQSYASLFPSAFVTYGFGPGSTIKGSYSRRIERPRTFFLNPFPDLSDTTFVRVGNPSLTPEYTDSFELALQYKFFVTLTPFYRRTTDVISRRFITDPETGRNLFTAQNLDSETNYGADLSLFGQFGPARGFISGSLFQAVTTDPDPTEADTEALSWNTRASLSAKLREGTDVQGFVFYRGPQKTVDGERKGFAFSSIGINQTLTESLRLSARINDPFGLAKFEFETDNGIVLSDTRFDPSIRAASFTLTYTFGSNQQRVQQQQPQQGGQDDGFGI